MKWESEELTLIRQLPLLARLPEEKLQNLLQNCFPRDYAKGQVLFVRGEPSVCFYVVLSGWVKVYRETPDGDEAVLGVFAKGEMLGEAAAFIGMDYPASAQIAEDARLIPVLSSPFRNQIYDTPEIAMNMLASMSHRLHHMVGEVEKLKTRSATLRVVDFLLKLCAVKTGAAVVALPYDKSLISSRLGIQPESLSRIFAKLRNIGVKTEHNTVLISDVGLLIDYSESKPGLTLKHSQSG